MKKEKIKNELKLEIYEKGGNTWYCDYYFYNGLGFEKGTAKASGYGYNKHSTATSNAINKFKFLYKFKNGLKWNGSMHIDTKKGDKIYGLHKDKTISYGIGISSVINCLNAFNNVKIKSINYGQRFDYIHLEIETTKEAMQKELEKNQKIVDNKKADKFDRKEAKETIEKIHKLFNI